MLSEPLAGQLWQALQHADALIGTMRSQQSAVLVPPPTPSAMVDPQVPPPTLSATADPQVRSTRPSGLLTGLGGLCIFVAVSVFLAFTWPSLPLLLKASFVLLITLSSGCGAWLLAHRELRVSADGVWALTCGLILLDVNAARHTGLFGLDQVSSGYAASLTGALMAIGSLVMVAAAKRTALRDLIAADLGVAAGVWFAGGGIVIASGTDFLNVLVFLTPLIMGLGLALWWWSRRTGVFVAAVGLLFWAFLAAGGLTVAWSAPDRGDYWSSFTAWPVVVCAAYAGGAAVLPDRWRPRGVDVAGAGACVALITGVVLAPVRWTTEQMVLLAAVAVVLAVVAVAVRGWAPVWSVAAWWCAAVVAGVSVSIVAVLPWLAGVSTYVSWGDRVDPMWTPITIGGGVRGWSAVVLAAGISFVGVVWSRRRGRGRATLGLAGVSVIVAALFAVACDIAAPLAITLVVALLGCAVIVGGLLWLRHRDTPSPDVMGLEIVAPLMALNLACWTLLMSATVRGAAVAVALSLSAIVLAVTLGYAASPPGVAAAAAAPALAGYALWRGLLGSELEMWSGQVLVVAAVVVVLVVGWRCRDARRVAAEIGAAGVVALGLAVDGSILDQLTAMSLLGGGLALISIVFADRRVLAWAAAMASMTSYFAWGVGERPESATVPVGVLLVVAGMWQMHRLTTSPGAEHVARRVSSWSLLGPGFVTALVPTALVVFTQPDVLRTAWVLCGASAALILGVVKRWQAPLVIGAGVMVLIVMRFLFEFGLMMIINPVGIWFIFGVCGITLLLVGIRWEASLRTMRQGAAFMSTLT